MAGYFAFLNYLQMAFWSISELFNELLCHHDLGCHPRSCSWISQGVMLSNAQKSGLVGKQFEDPDFGNMLCNLTNIKNLPINQAALNVLFTLIFWYSFWLDFKYCLSSPSLKQGASSVKWPDPFVVLPWC